MVDLSGAEAEQAKTSICQRLWLQPTLGHLSAELWDRAAWKPPLGQHFCHLLLPWLSGLNHCPANYQRWLRTVPGPAAKTTMELPEDGGWEDFVLMVSRSPASSKLSGWNLDPERQSVLG